MDWNDETIARIRDLWAEGYSTAEIGRRMGVTKNAVVGKAHRLNLPARPSPIRRVPADGQVPRRSVSKRLRGPTLPPLAAPSALHTSAAHASAVHAPASRAEPLPRPVVLRPVPTLPRPQGRLAACCWPLGEPGTPSFRFCSDPALPTKPYCADHAAIAYVKVRDRREDAA